jgi:hypothetical protein
VSTPLGSEYERAAESYGPALWSVLLRVVGSALAAARSAKPPATPTEHMVAGTATCISGSQPEFRDEPGMAQALGNQTITSTVPCYFGWLTNIAITLRAYYECLYFELSPCANP